MVAFETWVGSGREGKGAPISYMPSRCNLDDAPAWLVRRLGQNRVFHVCPEDSVDGMHDVLNDSRDGARNYINNRWKELNDWM